MKKSNSKNNVPYWQQTEKPAPRLRAEFLALLEKKLREQAYQRFIETNTRLVPREFVQNHGIHFSLVLRKLAFGADYHSDFVYLSKSSDDWNCVLIEIERPGYTFFKPGTNDFHRNFQKALEQINRWRAWFSNAANLTSFAETTVGMIRVPLSRNPTYPKYVLVYGRRIEYERSAIRRSLIRAQETDDFKIMTFDSLAEELESKHDLYVGVRHNEYIDIVSNVFLSESMFSSMPPDQIRIGEKLRANALATRQHWHHFSSREGRVMDIALPAVRRRPTTRNLSRAVLE